MKAIKKVIAVYGMFLICVFAALLIVGNVLANTYANFITIYLGQSNTEVIEVENADEIDTDYFPSSYESQSDLYADEIAYAEQVQAEGSVLLKNNGKLPMAKGGRITLLGSGSSKEGFLVSGGGSGSIDTSNTPTLKEVFEDDGYTVNDVMWNFYTSGAGAITRGTNTVGEAPVSAYGNEQIDSFADYSDAAIIPIGRLGSETYDVAQTTTEDAGRHMLELSQNELDVIDLALEHFDNVIVLLNTLNAIEVGPLMERDVSVLWVCAGGQQGLRAIPGLLNGEYNPSGRLVDTYVYDNYSAPAMVNFGDYTFGNANENFDTTKYVIYQEGIYVGYKYYETRYEDVVLGQGNAGSYDYDAVVAYPFGYGLSYTQFSYSGYSVEEDADSFEVSLTVTNSGEAAGKEVVQIYLQKPYDAASGVEVSAAELAGFAKTQLLEPGAGEEVTVSVPKEYLRSYSASANGGQGGYIVDDGDYYIAFGTNVHDALNNILAAKGADEADGMTDAGDAAFAWQVSYDAGEAADLTADYNTGEDGELIVNRLQDIDIQTWDDSFTYLSRSDWEGTWPQAGKVLNASDAMVSAMENSFPEVETAEMPATGQQNGYGLVDMRGLAYDAEPWQDLLDQMSVEDMQRLICNGSYGTVAIESINKDIVLDKDGPAGISATLIGGKGTFGFPVATLVAATWNRELASEMGSFIGEDALLADVSGWYAPAINIHRTPFSGRNFEYYSEDALISGIMSAEITRAAQEKGVYTYTKHYALNDQELNRSAVCTFSNEQAAREIYLRPFEINVRSGGSHGIMVSMNRIGVTWTGAHRGLTTDILRGEWGFVGCVVTDAGGSNCSTQKGLYGGTDLWLSSGNGSFAEGWQNNANVVSMMRNACHNILYTIANSNAMNGIAPGTQFVEIMAPWQICLVVLDVVLFAGCLAGLGGIVYCTFLRKSRKSEQ